MKRLRDRSRDPKPPTRARTSGVAAEGDEPAEAGGVRALDLAEHVP